MWTHREVYDPRMAGKVSAVINSLDKLDTQIIECKHWCMVAERLEGIWAIGDEVGIEPTLIKWPPILTAHISQITRRSVAYRRVPSPGRVPLIFV